MSGSGQLGTALVRQLVSAGRPVRAFVRPTSRYQQLVGSGVELVFGDLRDSASIRDAVTGSDVILATANVVAPGPGDTFESVEQVGYRSLIGEAARAGVQRFVYSSVPISPLDDQVPLFRAKRDTEKALVDSGVPYTIVRSAPFMESWLALPGSSVPLRGEENPTLDRPYRFLRRFRRVTGRTIEDKGRMTVIGRPSLRNAFISLHDVARMMLAAADHPDTRNEVLEVGGPEILTWTDIAELYSDVLGRPVKVTSLPPALFHMLQVAMRPFAPAASNIMGMNRLSATSETPWDGNALARTLGVAQLRTVREFLVEKAALPDRA
ncbi:MAG TPA: NmrA family NAD(P)-binding protein [Jiangellaceae bacterium]